MNLDELKIQRALGHIHKYRVDIYTDVFNPTQFKSSYKPIAIYIPESSDELHVVPGMNRFVYKRYYITRVM